MKIAEYLLRALEENGVRHIFGNPGTTEIPLVRLCEGRKTLEYVVSLSEVSAVPMADGYARSTRSLGVVNLHVAPGLGNGMGGLYTAGIARTPLLVLVGGQDQRFLHTGPILWGPIEKMAATVAKAVFTLNSIHDAAANVHQAIRAAMTRPGAPVVLICPPNVLEEEIDGAPHRVNPPSLGGLGAPLAARYADALAAARNPAIIAAEDAYWDKAGESIVALATALSAPVYAAPYTAALPIPTTSAHFAGYLPPNRRQIADRLAPHDLLVFIGGIGMRTTLFSDTPLTQAKLWIGNDAQVLASDGEFAVAAVADTALALGEIGHALGSRWPRGTAVTPRPPLVIPDSQENTLHPTRAIAALVEAFAGAIWVDESGLSTSDVRQLVRAQAGEYFINGSGGIGWGLAAAVGAAIGNPHRQVVAVIGDGSALYASEALWAAARQRTNLLLVVLSNGRYATLNEAASRLDLPALDLFSIAPPTINFAGLATLYGWRYAECTTESALNAFLAEAAGKTHENTLLDIKLDPDLKPVTAARHF